MTLFVGVADRRWKYRTDSFRAKEHILGVYAWYVVLGIPRNHPVLSS